MSIACATNLRYNLIRFSVLREADWWTSSLTFCLSGDETL